ncbi:MAG: hypothetical protein E4H19_03295 [Chromatiales bacterium]|jgi:hypothetical protein|nr:MAG: hypothetical protein E4H19_03295 [Chromatiales bacterium]
MTTLRERVGGERRRLKSVREALTAAVAHKSRGDAAFIPFYVAVSDYMETSMGRLHAQDVKMGDMIREKLGKLDESADKALRELDERLAGNQKLLHDMVAAKQRLLKDASPEAVERFETAGAAYTQYIVSSMGHHGATTDLAGRLFTQEDWEYMAGVTEEETRTEQEQYASVFGALPAALGDLQPPG